jgi:arylamine N-acetyltransferase
MPFPYLSDREKGPNLIFNPKFESDTIQDDQAVMNVSKTPTAYLEPPDHIVNAIRKSSVRTYIMKMENPTILNFNHQFTTTTPKKFDHTHKNQNLQHHTRNKRERTIQVWPNSHFHTKQQTMKNLSASRKRSTTNNNLNTPLPNTHTHTHIHTHSQKTSDCIQTN